MRQDLPLWVPEEKSKRVLLLLGYLAIYLHLMALGQAHKLFQPPGQRLTASEQALIANQQRAFDQFMRAGQRSSAPDPFRPRPAERRASGAAQPVKQVGPELAVSQVRPGERRGRMLVCYYTTKLQPGGPELVFPADPASDGFTPVLHYDTIELAGERPSGRRSQQMSFKPSARAESAASGQQPSAKYSETFAAGAKQETKFKQVSPVGGGSSFAAPTHYSFINDFGSNNGLIVNGPKLRPPSHNGNNGNNLIISGSGIAPDKHNRSTKDNNGPRQLEASSTSPASGSLVHHKQLVQSQRLVFSPPASRSFIVGGGGNNDAIGSDTKSLPLFAASGQQSLLKQSSAQTFAGRPSNLLPAYQQRIDTPSVSFKAAGSSGQPVEPQAAGFPVAGAPTTLDPRSISNALVGSAYRTSVQQQQQKQQPQQLIISSGNQQTASPANNQLSALGHTQLTAKTPTVGGNNLSSAKLSSFQQPPTQQVTFAGEEEASNSNLNALRLPQPSPPTPPSGQSASPSSSFGSSTSANDGPVSPSSSSSSSSSPTSAPPLAGQSPVLALSASPMPAKAIGIGAAGGGAGAANLISSPLSTMLDAFGVASQYLMRFKPGSLISPSVFAFNTIPASQMYRQNGFPLPTALLSSQPELDNSTLLGTGLGPPATLLPLAFAPNNQKAPQPSAAPALSTPAMGERSTASPTGGGFLSRFTSALSSGSSSQSSQRREDVCGRTIQTPQRRIIGGEGARYGEFPYQVHIKIAKHQCGGALVDRQSIVTAAHCVYHFITRAPVSKLQIVIGAYDIEDEQYQELPPQYFKVNKVKLHPNFRFSASHPDRYDIAILKLDKPVKYTDNVLPVCLPSKDIKFESMVGTVTGFGKTDPSLSNRYGTRLLQKVDVPIIENNECERWHRTRGIDLKIFPEMMCAGYEDGLKDACVGDSGGPLVVKAASGSDGSFRWTLAGITSAGFGCAQSRQPGIYHRVSHTVDWILENLD